MMILRHQHLINRVIQHAVNLILYGTCLTNCFRYHVINWSHWPVCLRTWLVKSHPRIEIEIMWSGRWPRWVQSLRTQMEPLIVICCCIQSQCWPRPRIEMTSHYLIVLLCYHRRGRLHAWLLCRYWILDYGWCLRVAHALILIPIIVVTTNQIHDSLEYISQESMWLHTRCLFSTRIPFRGLDHRLLHVGLRHWRPNPADCLLFLWTFF